MKLSLQNISRTFVAGILGGLANSLAVWLCGGIGLTAALGVQIAPAFTTPWLYQRLIWGGLWGWLFLLPLTGLSYPLQGLLFSLGPSAVQLFIVFPYQAQKGVMGLQLGYLTPVFVLWYNAVWGLAAAWWLKMMEKD